MPVIVIAGATATGKSKLALTVAQKIQGELVSADSRQVFRQLTLGTAKPSPDELAGTPHHLVNHLDVTQSYSAAQFADDARIVIDRLSAIGCPSIVVGGTGMYLKALIEGLNHTPQVPVEIRNHWEDALAREGIEYLQKELSAVDPEYFLQVDRHNARRLIRALSVHTHTGRKFSAYLGGQRTKLPHRTHRYCLNMERSELYHRIDARVDRMIEAGLVDEVRALLPQRHLAALQTVGYQELFPYFEGDYGLQEAIRLIKRNSRRYAKRQMTWFRNQGQWTYLDACDHDANAMAICDRFLDAV